MSDSTIDQLTCQEALDEILAARCEDRAVAPAVLRHVETCSTCRDAMNQLASASPATLALVVVMRGVSR